MNFWPIEVEMFFAWATMACLVGWVYFWQRYVHFTELDAAVTPLKQEIEKLESVERAFVSRFLMPGQGPGYVYLLEDIDVTHYVKIGRSVKPINRIHQFDVVLPFRTELLHTIPTADCVALETELHRRYAHRRQRGEWFSLTVADLEAIRSEYPS